MGNPKAADPDFLGELAAAGVCPRETEIGRAASKGGATAEPYSPTGHFETLKASRARELCRPLARSKCALEKPLMARGGSGSGLGLYISRALVHRIGARSPSTRSWV